MTHEDFIRAVRETVLATTTLQEHERSRLLSAKLTYGAGGNGARGITYYEGWNNGETVSPFIEVCAIEEESVTQLAGTTVHELAHVLAGHGAGHGIGWRDAANKLGLARALAAGQVYSTSDFEGRLWDKLSHLAPTDGKPAFASVGGGSGIPYVGLPTAQARPCPLGYGTRGGKSRGKGSGSRMRLYHCVCTPPVKVRVASDAFDATCNKCQTVFSKPALTQERV